MLIRFSVENFLSFNQRQVFSMAAGKHTRHKEQLVVVNGKRVLKAGLVYGANAAGKSNLIKAVNFGKNIALGGVKSSRTNNKFFRIDPVAMNRPGVFQYDFVSNGHIYSYGFAISYTENVFLAEWLYLCDNKEVCIFERKAGEKIRTDICFAKEEDEQRFNIYSDDVKDSTSFLAEICGHKLKGIKDFTPFFDTLDFFASMIVIFPQTKYRNLEQLFKSDTKESLGKLLNYFDTGIEEVLTEKRPIEEVLTFLPEDIKNDIMNDIQKAFDEDCEKTTSSITVTIVGKRFSFKKTSDGNIVGSQLMMNHGNPLDLFEIQDESDGTKRLFDLIPLYQKGMENGIIFIDELDRSFHTKLTVEFLQKFFGKTEGYPTQLIVTLHDSNVMNLNIFRQDEIWFMERKEDHSSELYSLNKFKERFDHSVAKDYLLGRYGAIPIFGIDDVDEEKGE